MKVTPLAIPEVLLIEPRVFEDERGYFFESYNSRKLAEAGITATFVQDNQSSSHRNVVRGLHYQIQSTQAKLVRAVNGRIFDVAVDLRRSSPTFGKWVGEFLSEEDHKMLFIPRGFAHGYSVLSEGAKVLYKADNFYAPEWERCVLWKEPALGIDWKLNGEPIVGGKDRKGTMLAESEVYP